MRMRKPCVFSRLRTLGCQVRLVAIFYLLLFQVILSQVDGSIRSDGRRPAQRQDYLFDAFVPIRCFCSNSFFAQTRFCHWRPSIFATGQVEQSVTETDLPGQRISEWMAASRRIEHSPSTHLRLRQNGIIRVDFWRCQIRCRVSAFQFCIHQRRLFALSAPAIARFNGAASLYLHPGANRTKPNRRCFVVEWSEISFGKNLLLYWQADRLHGTIFMLVAKGWRRPTEQRRRSF